MMQRSAEPFPQIRRLHPLKKGESEDGFEHVQRFLERFGYLEEGAAERGKLDEPTSDALAKYQQQHGLRRTAELNRPTRNQMATARCALPDMRSGVAFSTTCSWDRRELTFAFDTGTNDVPGSAELQAVRNAFQTWSSVTPLSFTEVAVAQSPDIRIGWRPANDPDLSMVGGTLAHADFPPGCGVVTNTLPKPVHFDDSEHVWSIGASPGAFDVETVALHEIGHILGLAHSNVAGSVMFPSVSANTVNRTLTADDLAGIQALYPLIERQGDSGNQAGFVSQIAAARHRTRQVVTAVRTRDRDLKLIAWRANGDGSLSRTGDSGNQAGRASSIDVARGRLFVVACRTSSGNLKLISWRVNTAGTSIQRQGDSGNQAGRASLIKVVAVTSTLFVVACRTGSRDLKLISWRLNADGSLTRLSDSGNAAGEVRDISLVEVPRGGAGHRVVTSVRTRQGDLKLIVWDVSPGGAISRRGDSGNQAGTATQIRSAVLPNRRVVTSVRAGNGRLKLISWRVSANGASVSRLGDSGNQAGRIGDNALMPRPGGVVSAVRTQERTLKLIAWDVSGGGAISRLGDSGNQAGVASRIVLCQEALSGGAPIVTSVRTEANDLKLISWDD